MTEWRASISPEEFAGWVAFYKLHPFDDLNRYYRPAALVATSMSGADVNDLLGWLERRPAPKISSSEMEMMKALGMKRPEGT